MSRRKRNKNLRKRYESRRILFSGCEDEFDKHQASRIYDPDFHPVDIVAYFKSRYEEITDPEYYRTKNSVGYVTKPVRPATQAAYAAKIGVCPDTLWAWGKSHDEFKEALAVAKAFEAALLVELGAVGALAPSVTNFILKNLQGWTDRVEETHKGSVGFIFDEQDREA